MTRSPGSKIVIAGLDNAGKTSLVIAMTKKFGIEEDLKDLKPTVRVARDQFTFLSQEIYRWDFGGQEKYREEYLAKRDRYFSGIDMLIFVVDIQDRDRFSEALEYFTDILEYLKQNRVTIPVSVFLHKYDPNLRENPETEKNIFSLKDLFNRARKGYQIDYYETSVNDLHSLIKGFSQSFTRLFRKTELVSAYFSEVASLIDPYTIMLFDESGLTVGEYYRPHLDSVMRNKILELYVESLELLEKEHDKKQKMFEEELHGKKVKGVIQKISLKNKEFTLLLLAGKEKVEEEGISGIYQKILPKLKEIVVEILDST
ncbi:MAG: ADP-ribosylation factor-like protein [Promethearchaeota archaeon]